MAYIFTRSNAHHLRVWSVVDIETGELLPKGDDGKVISKQQSTKLVAQDDVEHFSKKSPAVLRLAATRQEEIQEWERAALAGEPAPPNGNMLVRDFFFNIFMPYVKAEKEASTAKSYLAYYNSYLASHFNHTKTLKSYQPYEGTNLLEQLCQKHSENTVAHARALASTIFGYATAKGYIKYNPFRDVKKTSAGQEVEEGYAYSQAEIERILEAVEHVFERQEMSASKAVMAITLCFYAGLRPSEAAGLRWENVDLNNNRLSIKQAYVNGNFKGTKTGKKRTVVMLPVLAHRMRLWAMQQGHPSQGLVLPNKNNKPVVMGDLSARIIAPCLKFNELPEWQGFYGCRRGFGTMMVLAGATLDEVADAMGNSPDVVFKHYFKDKDSKLAASGMAKLALAMSGQNRVEEPGRKFRPVPQLEVSNG